MKIVEKPWGREIWLAVENEYAGKILEIKQDSRTSLQYHESKKESIYVLDGKLKVEYPDGETIVEKGKSITLNPGDKHRLIATIDPENTKSINLFERLGFRREAHFRKCRRVNGIWADDVVYALLREDTVPS